MDKVVQTKLNKSQNLQFIVQLKYLNMSKDQTDTHLRYGQGVIIKGYKPQNDSGQGFMTVRGFADTRANYETISDVLYFKNYRNGIFQFLPAGNFEINDQLFKLKSKIVDKGEEIQLRRAIQTLESRAESEKAQFQLSIKRNKKQTIKFGDYIMLRHIDSQTYLSGTIRPSDGTNGAFSVEVSNRLSASLVFQLLPYRSFEAESMEIPFSSPVLVKNVFNNGYLTFEKMGIAIDTSHLNNYMQKVPTHSDDSYRIPVKTATKNSEVFEVVTHFVDLSIDSAIPMPWQFQIHFKEAENDSLIQHDIVYLRHTENNGILSAIGEDIVLKEAKNQTSEGLNFYESLWQIEKDEEGPRTYIMRHLMSGMTLGVNKNYEGEPETAVLMDISEGPGNCKLGTIELQMAKKDGGVINSESFIYLCSGEYILDVAEEEGEVEQESAIRESRNSVNEDIINFKRMKRLMKNQLEYIPRRLKFSPDISKNCFVIQEIDDDLKKELLFALSFHSTIINLKEDLKWGATDAMKKVSYIRMMRVTQKIDEINDFLKDCSSSDPQKEYKLPVYKRQMICKDLGLSELLLELLFYIRENMKQQIFKQKINERQKFHEMHETIYKVIINLIKNNKVFKIHVCKWIMFIFEDFVEKGQDIHCEALLQLLKNNQFFLENFVNGKLIQYLFKSMMKERGNRTFTEIRYVNVLRAFCMVGEKVYSLNQSAILKNFIQKLQSTPQGACYQIKFRQEGKILCQVAIDKKNIKFYNFESLHQKCNEMNQLYNVKAWQYYTAYLNLLADLTKGRNKSIQKYVAKQLPLDLLSQLFEKYTLLQFEVPVIKIIHYLYSENENFYPIDKQNRIIAYDSIESSKITINHFTGPLSPWSFMERVLNKLIDKLSEAGPLLSRNIYGSKEENDKIYAQNAVLFELLKLTQETLNLGFWQKKEDLEKIFTNVLKIVQKNPLIDYTDVTKINKENELMFECKLQCLNIIDLIIDQDMNISLQVCNKVFREFQVPQNEKRGVYHNPGALISGEDRTQFAQEFIHGVEDRHKEITPIVDEKIYPLLIELSNYQNAALTCKSLEIMNRILDYKRHRINKFYSELFVCEPSCVMFAQFLTSLKNKFFVLEDINTTKITLENQSENYFNVYSPQKGPYRQSSQTGIMQDMYIITQLMKNENSLAELHKIPTLDDSGVFEKLGTQCLVNFTDCRKSSSLMKQKIVDAANIHLKILKYISNCAEIPEEELALKLLHMCYFLIVGLIENHQEMKPKIIPYMPIILKHLKKNIGCIDLLRELYDNNKNMLYNEPEIYSLIRTLCDQINGEQNLLYKAKLLDFFRYLIYLNNKCLRNNQIQILKIMQDDDYTSILVPVTPEIIKDLVQNYQEINDYGKFTCGIVKCSPQLVYMSAYFQILNSLIDQNNSVNIGKLIKRFPFELLNDCIVSSQDCWILKRNIRAVINRMYYFNVGTNAYLSLIIFKEIPAIIDDLDMFIAIKNQPEEVTSKLENVSYENPIRFNYLESHFYLNLEQNIFTLFSMLNTNELYDELEKIIKSPSEPQGLSHNLIRIAERLGPIKRYFKKHQNVNTNAKIKFLQSKLAALMMSIKMEYYEPGLKGMVFNIGSEMEEESSVVLDEETRAKNFIIQKISNGEIEQFYTGQPERYKSKVPLVFQTPNKTVQVRMKREKNEEVLSKKLRQIFTRKKRLYLNRDEEANSKMEKIVSALKLSKEVNKELIGHFEKLLAQCYEQRGEESKGLDELLDYISILIKINDNEPEILSEDLKSFILKIVISLFYQTNKKSQPEEEPKPAIKEDVPPPEGQQKMGEQKKEEQPEPAAEEQGIKQIDEWQAEDWQQNSSKINELQLKLLKCGVGSFITSLIKGNICNNIFLANQILLCSISYMLGGNKDTQNNIREELNKDPENKLLVNLRKLINKLGGLIRKNIDEENSAGKREAYISEFEIDFIDNYDYYDRNEKYMTRKNVSEPHYVDENIYHQECIVAYRRVFKFLQLLCENNNIDNKNFIREQPDTSQSIDFIEIATKQLRNIFQVFCSNIAEVPPYILDFILEVTQIPVKLNQDALIKSSFFEDVCLLADEVGKKAEGDGVDGKVYDQIFQKSVQIILSNFEGNSKDYFMLLDEKLHPNFLTKIMKCKLESLGISSKQNFNSYIEEMTKPKADKNGKLSAQTIFDQEISSILEIMIIFLKLRDVVGEKSQVYAAYLKQKQKNQELFDTLENCLLKIQIADENKNQLNVYYPKHPFFESISGGLKDYVMSQVARQTHRQKIISLLGFVNGIRQKITQGYNFQKCENISQDVMTSYYNKASNLSLIICLYMAIFYNVYIEYGGAEFTASWPIVIGRFLLSLVQVKYSVMFIYIWYRLNVWIKPQAESRESKEVSQLAQTVLQEAINVSVQMKKKEELQPKEKGRWAQLKDKAAERLEYLIGVVPYLGKVVEGLKELKQAVAPENPEAPKVQDSGQFIKNLIFVLVSLIGAFIYPPIIFIHIIDRVCSDETLANIFQAIGLVVKQLFIVSVLGVAFVVVFNSVTFSNYVRDVYGETKDTDEMCSNPISCVLALLVSGVIGETMSKFQLTRFTFDLIYAIFFGLLFGNIISGLMLDAFGELSDKTSELENDKKNFCYICNISRERLQKNGEKFQDHITKKHHLWNYIFYIIALQKKNETDYTGLEYYISQKYNLPDEEMDVSWIPDGEEVTFEKEIFVNELLLKLDETEDTVAEQCKTVEGKIEQFVELAKGLEEAA